jgi:hypothetical protein
VRNFLGEAPCSSTVVAIVEAIWSTDLMVPLIDEIASTASLVAL